MNFSHFFGKPITAQYRTHFEDRISERCRPGRHGDLSAWLEILSSLPKAQPSQINLSADTVLIGLASDLSPADQQKLDSALRALSPWRKGPFKVFNSYIDTEWRSDWKWQRLLPHISPLDERRVLDVGCGTGYHCWRMLGARAKHVLGIDPSMRFVVQNMAIQKYVNDTRFDFLPIGIEDMPVDWPVFDSVFSMGVLYHRRNPINHLRELSGLLRANGELVLETLIIDEDNDQVLDGVLRPSNRYAMMRNVWSILTVDKTLELLREAGFKNARCVDQNVTSLEEQRSTDWMPFHSLREFLDPDDSSKTIEGYPAPKRGIFIAQL